MKLKSHGRVPTALPNSRPFTFALPVRLTAKVIPVCLNGELKEMQAARKEKKEGK